MAKFSELWQEVELAQAEHTSSGSKLAIIEAHKVLEAALLGKGYPGKNLRDKLFWAGYSGKNKEGLFEAIEKHEEILEKFNYNLSDFEAEEIIRAYHEAIQKIVKSPAFGFIDRLKAFSEIYLSPKSIEFWKYFAIFIGFFLGIKLLSSSEVGKSLVGMVVNVSDFFISWIFVAIALVLIALFIGINYYFENHSKIKIKED